MPHPDAVGGFPTLPENTHSLSVPDSELRGWLESWSESQGQLRTWLRPPERTVA